MSTIKYSNCWREILRIIFLIITFDSSSARISNKLRINIRLLFYILAICQFCSSSPFVDTLIQNMLNPLSHSLVALLRTLCFFPWIELCILKASSYWIFLLVKISFAISKNLLSATAIWFSRQGPCTSTLRVSKHWIIFLYILCKETHKSHINDEGKEYLGPRILIVCFQKISNSIDHVIAISWIRLLS